MNFFKEMVQYISNNSSEFVTMGIDHIAMVSFAILLALLVGVPLGILAAKVKKIAGFILTIVNIIQIIPSLATLALLLILLGLGFKSVVIALFLYSLLPIVRNTYVGLNEVSEDLKEAGTGIGMTSSQLLWKVELPMSIPFLLAGLRIAVVVAIAVACLAPYIGGGGFGKEIISGISYQNDIKIVSGTIPPALLALFIDFIMGKMERKAENNLT